MCGCSGSGKGGTFGSGSGSTVVSGKVTLSASITGQKPSLKEMFSVPIGKPGSKSYHEMTRGLPVDGLQKMLGAPGDASPLSNATVDLYDADHPEWLFPVATGSTDSGGNYSLSTMTNATKNEGAGYLDGSTIPVGNYTLVASKGGIGQQPVVAVQTIVTQFEGAVPNVNFEVLPSDVAPAVVSILGLRKNTDGTETWGGSTTAHPVSAAIQIVFSMPMVRQYLEAVEIESTDGGTVPTGKWSLSADWLTATYYFDSGQELSLGKTYTVTIYGSDDAVNAKAVNVYGNPIEETAVATFVASAADTLSPTVQWNSPTVIDMGSLVDVTQSFRIETNEIIDVNGVRLTGSPSIGVKPGVVFLGKSSSGLYVYEFVLGEPLILNQSYSLSVSGGKDMSGHAMNVLTGSIKTKDAANTPGIDPAANSDTQNMQARVKSLFGRWVRSLNDRNLAQFQALMSPEFYMEYDTTRGISTKTDINRDGRYSISEFSRMIKNEAFANWDFCGTTITGVISPVAGTSINTYPLEDKADFEFKLKGVNTVNSQQCSESAPRESFYATVKFKNGMWRLVRASEGIDTRDKTLTTHELITHSLYRIYGYSLPVETDIEDPSIGSSFAEVPNTPGSPLSLTDADFRWNAVQGVQTYIVVVADARNPNSGRAYAFPSSVLSAVSTADWQADLGGRDVSTKFGFGNMGGPGGPNASKRNLNMGGFNFVEGGRYYWEVVGLATVKYDEVQGQPLSVLLGDITHASRVKYFTVEGVFPDLRVMVKPGTNPNASPVAYASNLNGYDVGSAFQATVTIESPNPNSSGDIWLSGSVFTQDTLSFDQPPSGEPVGVATYTVTLYQGWNYVQICNSGSFNYLCRSFGILTRGGKPPIIDVWEVIDDIGNTVNGDASRYFVSTTGAKKAVVQGGTDCSLMQIDVNLENFELGAREYFPIPVFDDGNGNCTYSFQTNIYKGDNWITLSGYDTMNGQQYATHMGVYTDTGSVWVPPISINSISSGNTGTATERVKYPNGADWEITVDPSYNYTANVNGKFKVTGTMGYYYMWSEAGSGSSNQIPTAPDGSFILNLLLYQGWNYITIYDGQSSYYNLNIFSPNGKVLILPKILTIDGADYTNQGIASVSDCYATIAGTAVPGRVNIYENSYSGIGYSYDYFNAQSTGAGPAGAFTVTIPIVGPNGYNYIDLYDRDNNWVGLQVTTTANCAYVAPSLNITDITRDDTNASIFIGQDAGSSDTITFSGTTNPYRTVTVTSYTCGGETLYSAAADANGNWSVSNVAVYGDMTSNQFSIQNGNYSMGYNITSGNALSSPKRPFRINSVTSSPAGLIPDPNNSMYCSEQYYSTTSDTEITISGVTNAPNGIGHYLDSIGGSRDFTISNGAFTITTVPVYDGGNSFNFVDSIGQFFYLSVSTTNGVPRPQFVKITSPLEHDTVSGSQTVEATVSDPANSGFIPTRIYAYIYNSTTGIQLNYSNDASTGYLPLNFDGTNVSFTNDFGVNNLSYTSIEVDACPNVGPCHYHYIYVNEAAYTGGFGKPGQKKANTGLSESVQRLESLKRMIRTQAQRK
jgi:hypothetical protein